MHRLKNKKHTKMTTNYRIYTFSWISVFSASLTEIFSVIAIFAATGSLRLALGFLLVQMSAEILVSLKLSKWLVRLNASWIAIIAIPFRTAAFALLVWRPEQPVVLIIAGICLAVSAAFSDVPRTIILSWWTSNAIRGQQLARFELIRYSALAIAPLIGGITFDFGGFVPVAGISIIFSIIAALMIGQLWAQLEPPKIKSPAPQPTRIQTLQIPIHVRLLWWATGLRYIAETALYPLAALMLYNQTTSVGWIIALSVLATIGFGAFADRTRAHIALSLAFVILLAGWLPRLFEISLTTALIAAILCAIGGKMMGLFEKKTTFDFGEKLNNPPALAVLRERELLTARVVLLLIAIMASLEITSALIAGVFGMIFLSITALIIIRKYDSKQESTQTAL